MKKILGLIICTFLIVSTISFVSAMTEHETEIYNKMGFFSKIKYAIEKGFFLFTSWGQANCCSVDPDKEKWIGKGDRIDCDDYCSYDKCAIDIWYDNTICLIGQSGCGSDGCRTKSPSGDPDWNKWLKEESGEGEYFRGSSYCWYYVEVYCCPKDGCVTDDHSTRAYVCENGVFDYKSRYDKDEYCKWDTSGVGLCWCADEDDRFYVDESGAVHCRGSPRSSWCTACTSHASKKCYSNDVYWYDSCGKRQEKKQECGTPGCLGQECKSATDCTQGQFKCVGSGTTSNEVVSCIDGKWGTVGGIGWANCISGTICNVGDIGTSVCYAPSGLICDYDLKCESGQGETTTTCPTDCCTEPDDTCNYATKEYYICKGTEWENQGKVEGRCGYTEGGCHGTKALGSISYCTDTCKCGEGEGDCDGFGTNRQCNTGLICVSNVGAKYGFSATTDVCEKESGCTSHASRKCYSNDVYWYDSCGVRETKKEECGTLGCPSGSSSCGSAKQCQSGADSNGNGEISRSELGGYIDKWIAGTKTRTTLGKAIMEWVDGC